MDVRPPLRWAGSKRKSLDRLRTMVPPEASFIIEPFAGSACFTFDLNPLPGAIGDINAPLIDFYRFLKFDPVGLHNEYISFEASSESYYVARNTFNKTEDSVRRAGLFLFLNRYCFNGIYRVNKSGAFNVPWGGEKAGKPITLLELQVASDRLSNIEITTGDFVDVVIGSIRPNALIYLDPPYARDEKRVFREYYKDSFATSDWGRLNELLQLIDQAGAHFILSYAGDSSVLNALKKWNVGHLDVTRNIGGFKSSRRKHREFLATNYEVPNERH